MTRPLVIIVPAYNEEAAIGIFLDELLPYAARLGAVVAVGLNDCTDNTRAVAELRGVIIGEVTTRGYGKGCIAAIDAVRCAGIEPSAYIFMAADGANDPMEIQLLVARWIGGAQLVLGQRTGEPSNWPRLGFTRAIFNVALGIWAGILSGRLYRDLGPFRLIDAALFVRIDPRETHWGWTIEPQVIAPRLGSRVVEVSVSERYRIAGVQKVTGVSFSHTVKIGWEIILAAWRSRNREPWNFPSSKESLSK